MPSLSIKINPVKGEKDEYYFVVPEEALPVWSPILKRK